MSEVSSKFAAWIARDFPTQAQIVECISISFEATSDVFNISDYGVPFSAEDENGKTIVYEPIAFRLSNQKVGPTTEQSLVITLDGLNGAVYSVVKNLTSAQRESLVKVTHRIYLDTDITTPVITPPSVYYLDNLKATLMEVELIVIGTKLPQRRAGQVYSSQQFPTLFFL